MKFDEVLQDLAAHVIEEANTRYLAQREWHEFKPFTCQREVITDGGSKFCVKIEFTPDPLESLMRQVAKN